MPRSDLGPLGRPEGASRRPPRADREIRDLVRSAFAEGWEREEILRAVVSCVVKRAFGEVESDSMGDAIVEALQANPTVHAVLHRVARTTSNE